MHEEIWESKAGVLIKTSLSDFPSRVAAVVFLTGCNFRCPYCYNTELVDGSLPKEDSLSLKEILSFLEKRKNVLSGLVVSGGEALLNQRTIPLIKEAKKLGYKIKVDTNGSFPEKLKVLLENPETEPDYLAMDIKASLSKLALFLPDGKNNLSLVERTKEKILESIKILSSLNADRREWRTVLVPSLVEKTDIKEIAALLPKDARWYFANFQNGNCIDPRFSSMEPYSDKETEELVSLAKSMVPGAELR